MKLRESGMPEENMWDSFFNPVEILEKLEIKKAKKTIVDLGFGYGTFTIATAKITNLPIIGFDIDPHMIKFVTKKIQNENLENIKLVEKDFWGYGTGLPDSFSDYVMIFNLLHGENPEKLLNEANRILTKNGLLSVIHWNYDKNTPRGPSMEIRPKPEDCRKWIKNAGFELLKEEIDLPPYHYGILAKK